MNHNVLSTAAGRDRDVRPIFADIQRLAGPGDRVLVIIGAGHAPILWELASADPAMWLVDTVEYLPAP